MQSEEEQITNGLIAKVVKEFPDLLFNHAVLVNNGEDHAVLVLDGKRVVRFPRTDEYKQSFRQELDILSALVAKRIRVPNYDHVSKERDFGSYALLQGTELRENVFKALPAPIQNVLVRDIGHFLSELHALPLAFVHLREDDGRWDSEGIWRYSDRYANEKRGVIKSFVEPKLLSELDDFFERLRNMQSTIRRVIHADVTDDHLLVNSEGKFAGVIDFGDATIGDPAFDFSYFWKYGDRVPAAVYANYTFKDDEKLLDRSRWHFVRYLSDRLFGAVEAHDFDLSEQITGTMQTALSRLPPLC